MQCRSACRTCATGCGGGTTISRYRPPLQAFGCLVSRRQADYSQEADRLEAAKESDVRGPQLPDGASQLSFYGRHPTARTPTADPCASVLRFEPLPSHAQAPAATICRHATCAHGRCPDRHRAAGLNGGDPDDQQAGCRHLRLQARCGADTACGVRRSLPLQLGAVGRPSCPPSAARRPAGRQGHQRGARPPLHARRDRKAAGAGGGQRPAVVGAVAAGRAGRLGGASAGPREGRRAGCGGRARRPRRLPAAHVHQEGHRCASQARLLACGAVPFRCVLESPTAGCRALCRS